VRHSPALVLAAATAFLPSCATTTGPMLPAYVQQPLSAGLVREYPRDFETVVGAAKAAIGRRLLKIEQPDARTTVIFGGGGSNHPTSVTRVVVQQLATGGVAVRVVLPTQTSAPSEAAGGYEGALFRQIEQELRR
jgi:hypothetical protein